MAVYKFQVSMPVESTLPRDYFVNTFHMEWVGAPLLQLDLDTMANDVIDLWNKRYHSTTREVRCNIYDAGGPLPNPPLASKVKAAGSVWTVNQPHEIALCLSFAANRSNPHERGRMYLCPQLDKNTTALPLAQSRPDNAHQQWALDFYRVSNESLPDLGGVDWKFGIWSKTQQQFHQAQTAWVDDEWDVVRSRGLKPTSRITATREG